MELSSGLALVEEFHRTFGLMVADRPVARIPDEVLDLRVRLLEEELREYRLAAEAGDLVAVADGLTDLLYVLFGAYVTHGLQHLAEPLLVEVHRSNMTKLDEAGRPILRNGKVQKSSRFSAPELAPILGTGQNSEE
jgi:predicted HAD superfamily Cof-like phosphohydrolase